ncbi:MAG: hypothetical protein JRN62_03185 [Nitrososphaerota archaeon]|nr:hypothetical protein [Nitrososphaerota archaeon]MDG6948601.1 hypothetical protein [Nitrososphaerota archaeon]
MRSTGLSIEDRETRALVHGKEIYFGLTLSNPGGWAAMAGHTCKRCHKALTGPFRMLWARLPGTKWSGRELFDVCANDYERLTGFRIEQKPPTRVERHFMREADSMRRIREMNRERQ